MDNTKEQLEIEKKLNQEKDKVIFNIAKLLKESGASPEEIHKKTQLPLNEINKL
ncbi:MAG: hypothetical protein HY738_22050 [Bacteroidia bacterium]|nr:hypothetical protein [Bacteroidia bacterium]